MNAPGGTGPSAAPALGAPSREPRRLPRRSPAGHKGTFGTVAVVGGHAGARRMIGAPALAAWAALRSGTGLARLVMPEPILNEGLVLAPSATGVALPTELDGALSVSHAVRALDRQLSEASCLAIGPGLGEGEAARALVLRAVQQETVPVVLDADGLNALAQIPELWRDFRAPCVLTPHPGEYRTLAAALNLELDPVDPATRPHAAEALARRLGAIVVLKGAGTVVTDGQTTWVCTRGHPCLATAGTGDVLTGIIAGLAAQFVSARRGVSPLSLLDAACVGVEAHAIAAERWALTHQAHAGLLALELADHLPGVLAEMTEA